MTDMTAVHADDPAAEEVAASFQRGLEQIVPILSDSLDHPEVWAVLKEVAEQDDVPVLLKLIRTLRPTQHDARTVKALDIVAAVLVGLAIDRTTGLEMLQQFETQWPLCPQVAGAYFFVDRAYDAERSSDLSERFCSSPFIKFETLIDGTVAPCCSIWTKKRLGHLDRQSADEIWNGIDAQEMRESILDGSFRYCNKQRCSFITDDSLPLRDEVAEPALRAIIDEAKVVLDTQPSWLFLAHDASCNLACPSCRDKLMGADEKQQNRFAKIEETVFHPILNGEQEVTISVSGQGDPWSSPHYRSILRYLADNHLNTKLNIHTNAMLMTEARWKQYEGLAKYRPLVDVSIDACSPWVYEMLRRPGKWERLEPNLAFLGRARAAGTFSEYHLNATIQLDNFHEMPALVDYAEAIGADSMRMYMMQNTGAHIAGWYARKNVGDAGHPLHLAFLETLRDPKLGRPSAHLYDVGAWRDLAFQTRLPSDALEAGFGLEALYDAIHAALLRRDLAEAAALAAAGRARFADEPDLLRIEADVLARLGFDQPAAYRRREAERAEAARATAVLAA